MFRAILLFLLLPRIDHRKAHSLRHRRAGFRVALSVFVASFSVHGPAGVGAIGADILG
ncbi:hypothetical protein [Dyella japonica]|uniref:hypothetical protein n=1 Tax=Dyella japonica TaxID=231455 RepID=UPI00035D6484